MKIFCDSADYKTFLKYKNDRKVKGFTTNPSLMRLAGAKNLGCEIITAPPKIIEQIKNLKKTLKTLTTDTVNGFYKDALKSKFKI